LPGIGPSTAAKILDNIAAERKVVKVLRHLLLPKAAAEAWPSFTTLIARLRKSTEWPAEFDAVRAWYERHLPRLYEDPDIRAEDIARLQQIAAGYRSRQRFLTELAIDPPERTGRRDQVRERDEEYTTVATIHWPKGGEWPIVRVLNAVDGCIPSAKASSVDEVEEERRLLHVAMTRAIDHLDLIVPRQIFQYQQGKENPNIYSSASRFIPKSIHHAFEVRGWDEREGDRHAHKSRSQSKTVDIAAAVERMWL